MKIIIKLSFVLLLSILATLLFSSCNSIEQKEEPSKGFSIPFISPITDIRNSDSSNIIKVDVKKDSVFVYMGRERMRYGWDENEYFLEYDNRLVYGRTDTGIVFIRKDKAIPIAVPDTVIKTKTDFIFQSVQAKN